MGPHWDGNEVWLITAGGVTFAAFPTTYAVMFSGLYTALMLILFALIIRGVSFVFQGGVDSPGWRKTLGHLPGGGQFSASPAPGRRLWQYLPGPALGRRGYFPGHASLPCSIPTACWAACCSYSSSWCMALPGGPSKPTATCNNVWLTRPGNSGGFCWSPRSCSFWPPNAAPIYTTIT